jgi:hypothetical protein
LAASCGIQLREKKKKASLPQEDGDGEADDQEQRQDVSLAAKCARKPRPVTNFDRKNWEAAEMKLRTRVLDAVMRYKMIRNGDRVLVGVEREGEVKGGRRQSK